MSDHLLPALDTERSAVYHADLFTLCAALPDASVDAIICDPPYGVTGIQWDNVIPLDRMWAAFRRVIKPRGAIVLTATQPYTSQLVVSNLAMFRYDWVWIKTHSPHFLSAERRPLGVHESVLVFSVEPCNYYPIKTKGAKKFNRSGEPEDYGRKNTAFGISAKVLKRVENDEYYPKTALNIGSVRRADMVHPTQKPVALFRYLIRTYTRAGELVFDPVVGSGTTALAARAEERRFIVGDSSAEYVEIARKRLAQPYTPDMFALAELQQQGAD